MTYPTAFNLGPIKAALAAGARVVPVTDSLGGSGPNALFDEDRFTTQVIRGFGLTDITAVCATWNANSDTVRIIREGSPLPDFIGAGTTYGVGDAAEYFGIPMTGVEYLFDGVYNTTTGARMARFLSDSADPFGGDNSFTLVGAIEMSVRLLYYGLSSNLNDRDLIFRDGGLIADELATVSLPVDARRYWHKGEGDPDAGVRASGVFTGECNALYPDLTATTASGVFMFDENWDGSNPPAAGEVPPNTGNYTPLMGAVCYQSSSGAWVGGTYISPLTDISCSIAGHAGNTASSVSEGKTYDDDNLTHWLDVTTLDRSQQIVVMVFLDIEAQTVAQTKADYIDLMQKWEASCNAIGLPAPLFLFYAHWYNGSASNSDNWSQGIYDAALTNPNAGSFSMYQALGGLEVDASGAGAFRTLITDTYGLDSFNYGSITGGDASTVNWSTDEIHPASTTVAGAAMKIMADAVSAGTYDAPQDNRLSAGISAGFL